MFLNIYRWEEISIIIYTRMESLASLVSRLHVFDVPYYAEQTNKSKENLPITLTVNLQMSNSCPSMFSGVDNGRVSYGKTIPGSMCFIYAQLSWEQTV